MRRILWLAAMAAALAAAQPQPPGWWMTEPIRWVQTNLRQVDATLDPAALVRELADMRANVVLMGMGGIVAYYPAATPFHYASPQLKAGHDLFGEIVREAHGRKIRVVGRYDFSKTRKEVFDAHPEWFFRQRNGEPVIYNGLYSTCINGGYYRVQALKILHEGLTRYDVDGLFFNMFGNQSRDYSGRFVGHCHCQACQRKYREMFQKEIPEREDEDYRKFLFVSSREVAAGIGELIHRLRPKAGYFNYIQEHTDGVMSESNTAIARPLPLWPYAASLNVNRARNSQPSKMAIDLNMQFVDYWWRWANVPAGEIALRAWQQLAHGGALTLAINGPFAVQPDRQALETMRPIFRWAAENERYFAGQESAARVLLLGASPGGGGGNRSEQLRGLFRLLTEEHIPFAVSDNLEWIGRREFDLVVTADWAPRQLEAWVRRGGRLLVAGANPPEFEVAKVVGREAEARSYLRVRDRGVFPSLAAADLLMLHGPFTRLADDAAAPLTFVPPSLFGPPEFIHIDIRDTATPGMVSRALGEGRVTWLPWDLGALYYRHSLPAHAGMFRDVVNALLPRRQVRTDAHPLVQVSLMRQPGRTLLHLVNFNGHSQTGYFPPAPLRGIRLEVEGAFRSARCLRSPAALVIQVADGYTRVTLPELRDYEAIVLE